MKKIDVINENFPGYMGLLNMRLQNEANFVACSKTYSVLQLREREVLRFDRINYLNHLRSDIEIENNSSRKETYTGYLSKAGKKNIIKTLNIWFEATKFHNALVGKSGSGDYRRLIFVTLTLSSIQIHKDKIIKEGILKPFLRIMRERFSCENYLWKAEAQDNGNIHFHVVFDRFIQKELLSSVWNKCQQNFGYMDSYIKRFGDKMAPSTNVRVIHSRNLSNYIAKYIGKEEEEKRFIEGAIWKKSKSLVGLRYFEIEEEFENRALIDENFEKVWGSEYGSIKLEVLKPNVGTCFDLLSKFQRWCYLHYCYFIDNRIFGSEHEEFYSCSFSHFLSRFPADLAETFHPSAVEYQEARQLEIMFIL